MRDEMIKVALDGFFESFRSANAAAWSIQRSNDIGPREMLTTNIAMCCTSLAVMASSGIPVYLEKSLTAQIGYLTSYIRELPECDDLVAMVKDKIFMLSHSLGQEAPSTAVYSD